MARVEVQLEHLATKEGLAEIKTLIEQRESTAIKWLVRMLMTAVGILTATVVAVALARIFM